MPETPDKPKGHVDEANRRADETNPYKEWHMRRAFRLGWEAAEQGDDHEQARARVEAARLNRMTTAAWWRGFRTQRYEW